MGAHIFLRGFREPGTPRNLEFPVFVLAQESFPQDPAPGRQQETGLVPRVPVQEMLNRFPPGVMSRPHFHRDERHGLVIKGTWYTGDGEAFTPEKTIPLKAGDYMRHPAGAFHYDGALDEEVLVAISGYGPSSTTVFDGGARFGKAR